MVKLNAYKIWFFNKTDMFSEHTKGILKYFIYFLKIAS